MSFTSDARPLVNNSFEDGDRTLQNPPGDGQLSGRAVDVDNTHPTTPSDDVHLEKPEPQPSQPTLPQITPPAKSWNPVTLRPWFAVCLIGLMVAVAIALEIALHFSEKKNGWNTSSAFSTGILHYVYTLPPVAVAMIIVALWAWTDVDIKRLQPYIDLAYGNAPASRTLLLDYSTKHPALVSYFALKWNHWIVALSSLMVLIGLALQPLAASLFTVKNIWWDGPILTISMLETPSQVGDLSRVNMSTFLTSAGFVQANVLFNAVPPNFVDGVWTIARVRVPKDEINNGTMFPITESYRSTANCQLAENINLSSGVTPIVLSATSGNCTVNVTFQSAPTSTQFGAVPASCSNPNATQNEDIYSPVAFYTLFSNSSNANPARAVVFCRPKIEAFKASASVAFQTGQLLAASIFEPLNANGTMADPESPGRGRPLNGIGFSWLGNDTFTTTLVDSVRSGLANAIVQNVTSRAPGGMQGAISENTRFLVSATEVSYSLYLSLLAKELYFTPSQRQIEPPTATKTFIPRLFIVPATSHILTATLLVFAILAAIVHYTHYHTRDLVVLPLRPGTLASAAAFTARSNLGELLETNHVDVRYLNEKRLAEILNSKLYGIDQGTGRVIVLRDAPGSPPTSPGPNAVVQIGVPVQRRGSVMALLRGRKDSSV